MYRFNPDLRAQGQNPFTWDGVPVDLDFNAYLEEELRYKTLTFSNPREAERLTELAVKDNAQRFKDVQHLSEV